VERGRSTLSQRRVEGLCLVFIAVVGIEVEVGDDLHRSIREGFDSIPLEQRVPNLFDGIEVKLIGKVSTNGIGVWRVFGLLQI